MSFTTNIERETEKNEYFRKVLHTGAKSQLVVMNIPVGGEIGMEAHAHVEQTIFVESGNGKAILDGNEMPISDRDVVVVSPGTMHNFLNTGSEPLKIYTVYSPPNHIDGRIHATKADAEADTEDEAFGNANI